MAKKDFLLARTTQGVKQKIFLLARTTQGVETKRQVQIKMGHSKVEIPNRCKYQ